MAPTSQLPFGKSMLIEIFNGDPQNSTTKILYLCFTAFLLIVFPLFPTIFIMVFNNDNITTYNEIDIMNTGDIIGLSKNSVYTVCILSLTIVLLLIIIDYYNIISWPKSFDTNNVNCYFEMFAEPKTNNKFIGHPGNSLSNCVYLFDAFIVLLSCINYNNLFYIPDTIFGINLLLLSIFSFIWHASNSPKSHYFDLWIMENCIIYLQIRYICLKFSYGYLITTILYLIFITKNGRNQLNNLKNGLFDDLCPFSSRSRFYLKNDAYIADVCIFMAMPIVFFIAPCIILLYIRSLGHVISLTVALISLSIGWGIRMFERFLLDGWNPINKTGDGFLMTAFLSPTAIFHVLTGITLISGYVHVRSLS